MNIKTIKDVKVGSDEYTADIVIDKIEKEGKPEAKAPLVFICRIEGSGDILKVSTWEYDLKDQLEDAIIKRGICALTFIAATYKDNVSIKLRNIVFSNKVSTQAPTQHVSNVTAYAKTIATALKRVTNVNYQKIALSLITNDFYKWPAAKTVHHAFSGGLAMHTCGVLANALSLYDHYSASMTLNLDLIITGAILHDIGKLREYNIYGDFTQTGEMLSHIVLGIEMVDEACTKLKIDSNDVDIIKLKHVIASHHGTYDKGSPNLPVIPEAFIINMADANDATEEIVAETLETMNHGESSPRNMFLNNSRLLKF